MKYGVGSRVSIAFRAAAAMSAMYSWCSVTSSRVPTAPCGRPGSASRVGHGLGRRLDVPGDVLAEVGDVDRGPPGVDDVDEHQRVVSWQVDVDVVGRVVGAEPGQVDALAADLQAALVLERLLRRRPGRVVVAQQEAARLLVADADDVLVVEEGRRSAVVGVVVRVDEVGHLVADAVGRGDLVDGPPDVVADGRRGVEQHDAVGWSGTPTGRCRRSPHRGSARHAPRGSPARSGRGRAPTSGSA